MANHSQPPAPTRPPAHSNQPSRDVEYDDGDTLVLERLPQKLTPPPMYQVVMLNDDFTPMEFVVQVLQDYFAKDEEQATRIMLAIHTQGRGVCGVYSHEIAITKVAQVTQVAQKAGHPLMTVAEPIPPADH